MQSWERKWEAEAGCFVGWTHLRKTSARARRTSRGGLAAGSQEGTPHGAGRE